ncbi:MAG: fused MFS/spermidine synthase [Alphaproteobacteria bacterium]|nr:fused MFS/spermidine synthase [Alphaproteobacteria bacterium]
MTGPTRRAFGRWALGGGALAAMGACGVAADAPRAAARPAGRQTWFGPQVIDTSSTEFNDIEIERQGDMISMIFKVGSCRFVESIYDASDPAVLPVEYTRYITAALAYPPAPKRLLEIGLGGGRTISYLHRFMPQLDITGVEIDPGVVAMAKKHFGVREDARLRLVVADGRRAVNEAKTPFDVIMVDAYRGTWVPETLTTVEFFTEVKAKLTPGGVVAQNVEPTTLFYDHMVATLGAVFANVDAYTSGPSTEYANTVLIAYDGPAKTDAAILAAAQRLQAAHKFRHPLPELVRARRIEPRPYLAAPFRDGFEEANKALMIDKANDKNTPRQRKAMCQ